ncbi:MAG: hypothetical protein CEE38_06135 [Planctomycetes bacterium B3_Pla]|nr:MAG: hypothetical protein CEE38_06135 [Planctomycetes bacterium B3_Pla]
MHEDDKSCLNNTRIIARAFIEEHYPDEAPLFDVFWETFASRMQLFHSQSPGVWPAPNTAHDIITEVSFAAGGTLDFVTPITLATLSATLHNINRERLSSTELKRLIRQSATQYGSKPRLTAALVRHISALCMEILTVKADGDDAVVSAAPKPQYKIWTNGESWTVDSISKYEEHKDDYLFWIDLNERSHVSKKFGNRRLTPRAVKLLKYLIERLGTPAPVEDVMKDVFDDVMSDNTEGDKNKIDQQLSKLNAFCGGQFREYCFTKWFDKGLGLKTSFADEYFLFER